PILDRAPDLAVEVLSKGNTRAEMDRKLREYFAAGVRLVWLIDPKTRTARVHTSPEEMTRLGEGDTLDGGDVLPGFALPLRDLLRPDARLCELVDGILVEKAMGYDESLLAVELIRILATFVLQHRLGEVTGPDGTMRLMPGLVRIPDVAFTSRARLPKKGARR